MPVVLTDRVLMPYIGVTTKEFAERKKAGKSDKKIKKTLNAQIIKAGQTIADRWQEKSRGAFTIELGTTHGESKPAVVAYAT